VDILITGAGGFMGRHLRRSLTVRDQTLWGVGRSPTDDPGWLEGGRYLVAPVEDMGILLADRDVLPSMVIHCASETGPAAAQRAPSTVIRSILDSTVAAASWCRTHNVPLIHISSFVVYGSVETGLVRESDACHPLGVYANAKLMAEMAVQAYMSQGLEAVIVRPGSLYGPGERRGSLVRTIMSSVVAGMPVTLTGGGYQTRDFLHIDDFTAAIWAIVSTPRMSGVYNVGSGRSTSVRRLAELCCAVAGADPDKLLQDGPGRPFGDGNVGLAAFKLYQRVNWRPYIHLLEGLKMTYGGGEACMSA